MTAALIAAFVTGLLVVLALNFVTAERRLAQPPPRWYGAEDADFRRATGVLLGPAILPGNRIETLVNGSACYPRMLEAIEQARETLCFETFIYWSGDIGAAFAKAFSAAAARGVSVHVLLDWAGTRRMPPSLIDDLRAAGVSVHVYHPLSWYHLARMNNRTHRKLLIVDGRIGFTGGIGVAPHWCGDAEDSRHWRDNHYRVEGPVVAQMQAVFLDNWIKATGEVLHGERYFPKLEARGDVDAQMFGSSPSGGSDSMHLLVMLAITAARRTIDIANSYFVPDRLVIRALCEACQRGVRVRVLVPGRHTDQPLVRRASRAHWDELLRVGVQIHEFMPTMMHAKLMIIDGHWTSVGSANFDTRSFRLNDEANLNVFSRDFAQEQETLFERDLLRARRIQRRRWLRRPNAARLVEWLAARLRSQL